jgi:hypothetical protein
MEFFDFFEKSHLFDLIGRHTHHFFQNVIFNSYNWQFNRCNVFHDLKNVKIAEKD